LSADHNNLADTHNANGNTCEDCHGDGPKKPVPMQKCLSCHKSYAKVATRTQDLDPNPHDSHLIDLACTKCHQGHKPQVNYCQTCHADMEFKKK
jgi:DnaJ-class molecular chaperone